MGVKRRGHDRRWGERRDEDEERVREVFGADSQHSVAKSVMIDFSLRSSCGRRPE